jgi:tetratricopeptide (TPR) repeat protein
MLLVTIGISIRWRIKKIVFKKTLEKGINMKKFYIATLILFFILASNTLFAESIDEYIKMAQDYQRSSKPDEALEVLKDALSEYPDNSTLYAYTGLYTGMKAGQTNNFLKAGQLSSKSFKLLDKAVSLSPDNPIALLFRGLMSVKVPGFLGKLDGGIKDLQRTCDIISSSPDKLSIENTILAWDLLGTAYKQKGALDQAAAAWGKIVKLAPGSDAAESADAKIRKLNITDKNEPKSEKANPETGSIERDFDSDILVRAGGEAFRRGDYQQAREKFEKAVEEDPQSAIAYKWLGMTIAKLGEKGYDDRIAGDTDLRIALVFESMENFDKAVDLAPDDPELRFIRGSMGVYFPFFTQKLEQAIKDLNMVLDSEVSDSLKSETLYMLGVAYQRKGMSYWIDVAVRHSESVAAQTVYNSVCPDIKRIDLSKQEKPCLIIDFVLGFQDELAPQTAVWIEDKKGNYVNTIYVSGFSGHVKDTQIVLPLWAESSTFTNIDAVTSASIDIGHHIYTWDLNNFKGNTVNKGDYIVNVEVSHWPSMKYQLAKTIINIGDKNRKELIEEGNFIPYFEVQYLKN